MFQSGLRNISSTDMNILGIQIMPSSKEIKLDLSDYIKNSKSHEQYKTDKVVETLQCIQSMSTQVELKIDAEAKDTIDIVGRGVDKIFPTICSCVLNVGDRKQCEWILEYTLSGHLVLERKIMARIYHLSRHAIIGSSPPGEVQHPDFADEQKRKVTFNDTVFHTKAASMAEAGFFCDGLIDRARCYYCGGARIDWKELDDPWTMHAEGFPRCPLVKAHMSEEAIDEIIKSDIEQISSGNPYYESLEKRKLTMHSMLMTQSSGNNGDDKEKFLSDVAEAGFYYVGPEDRVRCFSCGVMLSGIRLRTLEKLLIQHACVSSTCMYVKSKFSPDKLQCVINTTTIFSKYLSVCFFVKTFDRDPSTWPSNMLCS
ncbi:E3 ubiquitin-protein ligase XIAP-like [Mizuhopecten yessoensis]|uniref:E3 ubiquitin-protein ligase XIAP-like n=1 Tax=Mizuhopecten yessoensis TaxID=6573 RepID=UPI000B45F64C|nr:E3 ubiquitin-protein ligase XIAP-like [Mizuhopecten yessoensis]